MANIINKNILDSSSLFYSRIGNNISYTLKEKTIPITLEVKQNNFSSKIVGQAYHYLKHNILDYGTYSIKHSYEVNFLSIRSAQPSNNQVNYYYAIKKETSIKIPQQHYQEFTKNIKTNQVQQNRDSTLPELPILKEKNLNPQKRTTTLTPLPKLPIKLIYTQDFDKNETKIKNKDSTLPELPILKEKNLNPQKRTTTLTPLPKLPMKLGSTQKISTIHNTKIQNNTSKNKNERKV